jgi:integrase
MERDRKQIDATTLTLVALNEIGKKLNVIDEKVTVAKATLPVSDALILFRKKIDKSHKCPRNLYPLLDKLRESFSDRDCVTLTSYDLEGFIDENWAGSAKSTINARLAQLSLFFNFCIKETRKRGFEPWHNPVELIDRQKRVPLKENKYLPPEKIRALLYQCDSDKDWLIVSTLLCGLRSGELLKLRPMDISGRSLRLIEPKSGKREEFSVAPALVISEFQLYINKHKIGSNEKIFGCMYGTSVNKLARRKSKAIGEDLTAHSLRKIGCTVYDRAGDHAMRRFVLRHGSVKGHLTSLESRYVSPYTIDEACVAQDKIMVPSWFEEAD